MNSISSGFRSLGVATMLMFGVLQIAVAQVPPAVQGQAAAPVAGAAQSTFCGSQPLCYEASDFAATITDFRTSTSGGYKVIDVIIRFQNKTNQPLILGYLANSGTALDDRGNRYIVYGANGFRGIGQVYGGTNFDPKFSLRGGGFGDAQFELMWAPGQTPYGLTFELNMSVDEINTIEAGQHTLGGEFPLHYRGLTNGVSSAAPGQATAFNPQGLAPCSPTGTAVAGAANSAGGQTAAGANTAVSNAAAAISNFGSLFGKKKAAAPAAPAGATTTAGGVPCAPAVNGSSLANGTSMTGGTSTGTSMSAVNTTGAQTTSGASATTATPTATQRTATTTATQKAATTPAAKPVLTNAAKVTPVPPANAAVKKTAAPPPPAKPVSQ